MAPTPLAPGWDEEDVAWLREMAQLGMELAREVVAEVREHRAAVAAGEAQPLAPAAAVHAELRFSRITRAVRLALSLKARARGAEVPAGAAPATATLATATLATTTPLNPLLALGTPFNPVLSMTPLQEPGYPGTDPAERITFAAGEVRRELAHVFEAPEHEAAEVERLWGVAEDHIDRARANPGRFVVTAPCVIVDAICEDLGIAPRRQQLMDHRGWVTGRYIARPDEPDDDPVLTGLPPVTDFMLSRRRGRLGQPP